MPLLMCPNDNSSMQTLERSGVQFDMCPTCRGVWLDRGELEKLMDSAVSDAAPRPPEPPRPSAPPVQPWGGGGYREEPRYRDDRYRDDRYRDDDYRKRKKRDSIFDIFD